jgi:hypothetical protein
MGVPSMQVLGTELDELPLLKHLLLVSQSPPVLVVATDHLQVEPKLRAHLSPEVLLSSLDVGYVHLGQR